MSVQFCILSQTTYLPKASFSIAKKIINEYIVIGTRLEIDITKMIPIVFHLSQKGISANEFQQELDASVAWNIKVLPHQYD